MVTEDIKEGYKETRIGILPKKWEVKNLGQVVKFLDGKRKPIKSTERSNIKGQFPYYGASGIIDYVNDFIFDDDLILLGEDGANILTRSTPLAFKVRGKIWVNNHAHVLKTKDKVDIDFLVNYLESINYNKYTTGIAQPKLNKDICLKIPVPYPSFKEQNSIGNCLSTWDKAIDKQEALLKAKQQVKQGLMQQLLSGKKRLPGFAEEWKKVGAGKVFKSVSIKNKPNNELLSVTQDRGVIPRDMLEGRVTMPAGNLNTFKLVQKGNFVISLRSFQGGLEYSNYNGLVSPAYTVLEELNPICRDFYKYYFKSYEFIERLSTAVIGIRDGKQISYNDFCIVKIPLISLQEQEAIANVLSTADKELEVLSNQLNNLKEQKKGLMQQLLTGKKRLKYE